MANYASLYAAIAANIYTNHEGQVTAEMVKAACNSIVNSLGYGYQFRGAAAPGDAGPGSIDQRVFYIASTPGTYSGFGGLTLAANEVALLKWDTEWHKETLDIPSKTQIMARLAAQDAQIAVQDGRLDGQDQEIADFEEAVQNQVDNYPMLTINGNVTNAPDEEDITSVEENGTSVLKFKNRSAVDGMGYVILRKGGSNTFANQVAAANTIYEVRYEFDLGGGSVTIPSGSILRFNGGKVTNGTIVLDDTEIQGAKNSIACLLSGTFKNEVVYSSWFVNADAVLRSAIKCCSEGSNTFYFEDGNYTFTDDVFIYNSVSIKGSGGANIVFDFDTTGKTGADAKLCGFLCGAAYRHDNTYQHPWVNASIEGINIGYRGSAYIQALIYLNGVKNVAIRDCYLDITGGTPPAMNAVICRKNNADIALPTDCDGITISGNTLVCDKEDFSFGLGGLSGECIGLQLAKNVLVENNRIYRATDDLGFHSCENVRCVGNYMSAYDGRYYASAPVNYWLEDNILEVQKATSMGIMVDREGSDIVAKNIHIKGNKVFATGTGAVSYGIRVFYGKGVYISDNEVQGIVIENSAAAVTPETLTTQEKIANEVYIYHNSCSQIRCQITPDDPRVIVFGNNVRTALRISPCFCSDNILGSELTVYSYANLKGVGYIDFAIKPGTVASDANYLCKTPTGETEITIPFKCVLLGMEIFASSGANYSQGYAVGNLKVANKQPDETYVDETYPSPGVTNSVNWKFAVNNVIINAESKFKTMIWLNTTSTYPGYIVIRAHFQSFRPWHNNEHMFFHPYHADNIVDAINAVDYGDLQPA